VTLKADFIDFPVQLVDSCMGATFLGEAELMEVRLERKTGTALPGLDPVLAAIQQRLQSHPAEWLQTLAENPGSFMDLERTVHGAFRQMADQLVAGLLAQATGAADFAPTAKKK
jgi:hypothetical protein